MAAISTDRRNTLTKTQKMACMLMNQRGRRGLYGGRESGAVGPLEASRGAEVVQWTLGYAAVSWLILQVAGEIGGTFEWSPLMLRTLVFVLIAGTVPAAVIAWFHGDKGQQAVRAAEVAILVPYGAIVGLALWQYLGKTQNEASSPSLQEFQISIVSVQPSTNVELTIADFDPLLEVVATVDYSFNHQLIEWTPDNELLLDFAAILQEKQDNGFIMQTVATEPISAFPVRTSIKGSFGSSSIRDGALTLQIMGAVRTKDQTLLSIGAPVRIVYQVAEAPEP